MNGISERQDGTPNRRLDDRDVEEANEMQRNSTGNGIGGNGASTVSLEPTLSIASLLPSVSASCDACVMEDKHKQDIIKCVNFIILAIR